MEFARFLAIPYFVPYCVPFFALLTAFKKTATLHFSVAYCSEAHQTVPYPQQKLKTSKII